MVSDTCLIKQLNALHVYRSYILHCDVWVILVGGEVCNITQTGQETGF